MSDPQFGKLDRKTGSGQATSWNEDIANVRRMCDELHLYDNIGFLMITGDLAEAYPVDEGTSKIGRLPGYRPPQLNNWLDTMRFCPQNVPLVVTDGNHDIGNNQFKKHAWMGYEQQFTQLWYHFIVSAIINRLGYFPAFLKI